MLAGAGLVDIGRRLPAREATSWLVRHESGLALLRRLDPALFPPDSLVVRDDLAWLHGYLDRLAATGFPSPHPVAALDGASWLCQDDALLGAGQLPARPDYQLGFQTLDGRDRRTARPIP